MAHRVGAKVLVDGAQAVPHMAVDINDLDADFYAFSGHKMLGPTGIGVLWGRPDILSDMDPFLTGGEMIREVWLDHATWNDVPYKFEAGTPPIAEAVALSAAIDYLTAIGMGNIRDYCHDLSEQAYNRLSKEPEITVYGPENNHGPIVTFSVRGIHPHDVAAMLDQEGVAIRAGHHCAQPLMRWLEVDATARASFYLYNTAEDIDVLVDALRMAKKVLHVG
jgi:cysteine desulfurase/selenocysteine lyase